MHIFLLLFLIFLHMCKYTYMKIIFSLLRKYGIAFNIYWGYKTKRCHSSIILAVLPRYCVI